MHIDSVLHAMIWAAAAGVLSQFVSERLRQPSIFFLLLSGLVLGPHGARVLIPDVFRRELPLLVEAAVIVILFEGAMTLRLQQFTEISGVIRRLVTLGGAITMILAGVAAHLSVGAPWGLSFLFGALVSVTGPTVIGPIVKRVKLKKEVSSALLWESIVLDPIGAVAAVIVLEILLSHDAMVTTQPFLTFPLRLGVGAGVGFGLGFLAARFLRIRRLASLETRKNLVLVLALASYALSETLFSHSGLVAIVTLGIYLGNTKIPDLDAILEFKSTLTSFLLSVVFVLLAANLNLYSIRDLGVGGIIAVALVILVVRPINIWLCTVKSGLTWREKSFLSWMAPRGIVAASLASLFTLNLQDAGYPNAETLEALVYLVIGATVTFQGLTAGLTAKWLRVQEPVRKGFLLVGAHPFAQELGLWLKEKGLEATLIDTDGYDVTVARARGLTAVKGSILDESLLNRLDLSGIGRMLALTTNDEVNVLSCQLGTSLFGKDLCFRPKEPPEYSKIIADSGGQQLLGEMPPIAKILKDWGGRKYRLQEISLNAPLAAEQESITSEGSHLWPLFWIRKEGLDPIKVGDALKAGEKVLTLAEEAGGPTSARI